jgi:diphthamide biosynthesis methyltransferase
MKQPNPWVKSQQGSIQAWEALIEQNREEAEEELSILRVSIHEMRAGSNEMRIGIDQLRALMRDEG